CVHPASRMLGPLGVGTAGGRQAVAGFVSIEARASRTEVGVALATEELHEAETVVAERDWPIRIAFTCRDRVTHSGDQETAHSNVGGQAQGAPVGPARFQCRNSCYSPAYPQRDLLAARLAGRLRRTLTVIEAPRAACLCRNGSGEPHA